jgi:hypothetical protein
VTNHKNKKIERKTKMKTDTYFDQARVWDLLTPRQSKALRQIDDSLYINILMSIEFEVTYHNLSLEEAIDAVIGDCHDE